MQSKAGVLGFGFYKAKLWVIHKEARDSFSVVGGRLLVH